METKYYVTYGYKSDAPSNPLWLDIFLTEESRDSWIKQRISKLAWYKTYEGVK